MGNDSLRAGTSRRAPARPEPLTVRVPGFTLTLGVHPAGSSLPRHDHPDPTICVVVRGGFTEYSGGEAVGCGPGTVKAMPAGEPHRNRFGERETRGLRIDVDRARFTDVPAIHDALDERHRVDGGLAAQLGRRLVAELVMGDEAGLVAAEGLALELLAELSRERAAAGASWPPPWLGAADDLIREQYASRLTVSGLARAVDVHPATLSRRYRDRFGCTVGERIRRLRVERAARELVESASPLGDIALQAGFYDQSHFTNIFRRALGVTPGAYRRLHGSRGRPGPGAAAAPAPVAGAPGDTRPGARTRRG